VVDLKGLGEAPGDHRLRRAAGDAGTRTAAITGGFVALGDAATPLKESHFCKQLHGTVGGRVVASRNPGDRLGLCRGEDSNAETAMKVV